MSSYSKIEWTEAAWNPVTGCTKISDGCLNCYAERLAARLKAMGNKRYENGFNVTLHQDLVDLPLKWKQPQMIFLNSMSDLFHEKVPASFIRTIFETMEKAHWHTFQILTKRSKRLIEIAPELLWPPNVWMSVTVEAQKYTFRISDLLQVPAAVRYLSLEPFIMPISDLPTEGIDWVIVGGESGPESRIMKADWVRSIRDQCLKARVSFFFKQWGGSNKSKAGRMLDGRLWDNYPSQLLANLISDTI
jgi:protein gp37